MAVTTVNLMGHVVLVLRAIACFISTLTVWIEERWPQLREEPSQYNEFLNGFGDVAISVQENAPGASHNGATASPAARRVSSGGSTSGEASSQDFYSVAVGNKPGIYRTWQECDKAITGYGYPVFMKFFCQKCADHFKRKGAIFVPKQMWRF